MSSFNEENAEICSLPVSGTAVIYTTGCPALDLLENLKRKPSEADPKTLPRYKDEQGFIRTCVTNSQAL